MKKTILLSVAMLGSTLASQAVIYSTNINWTVSSAIPDNNYSGWINSQTVATPGIIVDGSLAVNLQLSSGWTGDLYAYLMHDSGFVVLLDRVGIGESGAGPFGYGGGNMNVTLADDNWNMLGNLSSIHGAGASPSGTYYNPDNNNSGLSSALASGGLGSFNGLSPNGTWTLFVADLSGGGVTTVQSWGLQMDIVAVPEVETWIAAALAGAFGAFWLNRQIWGTKQG